ncbi:hypothetical protein MSNKSG1_08793 [Marinobacter santoriniensis NKSG1]|uniref:Lipopolysaccharide biosynthesis protein n=1 Tax=Marinobacter santoriniensis NKSG1 TaxID=1288826 RepID=M7CQP0_9GAMM|nr:Wzz/FepE/Etk N-terminal domain-containing protein [Marinobacter santoriniensis]EMP55956.1 hypothetical protein MSNKSG1_08793 [Marinobacter santoriniensis NKSG1]
MNQAVQKFSCAEDEIDLRALFATLWQGKWLIIVITFLCAAAGVGYALYKPNVYTASAVVAPAQDSSGGMQISGQLSGLASLAGVNLGSSDTNKTAIAKEVLQSRAFLTDFIHRHQLAVPIMATTGWSEKTKTWRYNTEVYNPHADKWLTNDEGESFEPTDWDLVKTFRRQLNVSQNSENGMLILSITSYSPMAASNWVSWLIQDINEHMRAQDVQESQARMDYLEKKLRETSNADMQRVFYQLIEKETRIIMLANAQPEYIFRTIDPAVPPQDKSGPKRALMAVLATLLGGMLGVFVVFVRAFIKRENGSASDVALTQSN